MTDERSVLARECRALAAYLSGKTCSDAVVAAYVDAHAAGHVLVAAPRPGLDRALLSCAGRGVPVVAIADAYASIFARTSNFRRKLILVLALLETTAPDYREIDTPASASLGGFLVATTTAVAGLSLRLVVALPWFGTLALLDRFAPTRPEVRAS